MAEAGLAATGVGTPGRGVPITMSDEVGVSTCGAGADTGVATGGLVAVFGTGGFDLAAQAASSMASASGTNREKRKHGLNMRLSFLTQ